MLHRLDVAKHRLASDLRVVPFDGREDLSVGRQRFMGSTRGLQ
jgi:hypothetical protein